MTQPSQPSGQLRILVYSDNPRTREQVKLALGKRVHPDLPELTYLEVATPPMVIRQMDEGGFDLVILDGEATPAGGMGIAKQLKDEIADCPPILVLTGRADDKWLASWSNTLLWNLRNSAWTCATILFSSFRLSPMSAVPSALRCKSGRCIPATPRSSPRMNFVLPGF